MPANEYIYRINISDTNSYSFTSFIEAVSLEGVAGLLGVSIPMIDNEYTVHSRQEMFVPWHVMWWEDLSGNSAIRWWGTSSFTIYSTARLALLTDKILENNITCHGTNFCRRLYLAIIDTLEGRWRREVIVVVTGVCVGCGQDNWWWWAHTSSPATTHVTAKIREK